MNGSSQLKVVDLDLPKVDSRIDRDDTAIKLLCAMLSRPGQEVSPERLVLEAYRVTDLAISTSKLSSKEMSDRLSKIGFR